MAIGKVIKGDSGSEPLPGGDRPVLRPPRPGVMNAEVFEARQGAQGIIEEAQREKERIIAEAQREKEDMLAKAREQGRQEGLAQATETLLRAKMQAGEILAREERDVVTLACKIAEKIIGRDVERDPALLADICAKAIEELRSARAVVLRVNPKTAAVLRARKAGADGAHRPRGGPGHQGGPRGRPRWAASCRRSSARWTRSCPPSSRCSRTCCCPTSGKKEGPRVDAMAIDLSRYYSLIKEAPLVPGARPRHRADGPGHQGQRARRARGRGGASSRAKQPRHR